ncbi:hypothetical protein BGX34_006018, partial [Mortierella sp. NVP85]
MPKERFFETYDVGINEARYESQQRHKRRQQNTDEVEAIVDTLVCSSSSKDIAADRSGTQ